MQLQSSFSIQQACCHLLPQSKRLPLAYCKWLMTCNFNLHSLDLIQSPGQVYRERQPFEVQIAASDPALALIFCEF